MKGTYVPEVKQILQRWADVEFEQDEEEPSEGDAPEDSHPGILGKHPGTNVLLSSSVGESSRTTSERRSGELVEFGLNLQPGSKSSGTSLNSKRPNRMVTMQFRDHEDILPQERNKLRGKAVVGQIVGMTPI